MRSARGMSGAVAPRGARTAVRVVICGGGTGGHIYPGLAIAEALAASRTPVDVLFVGSDGPERQIVPRAGWAFRPVASRKWPRRLTWTLLQAVWLTAVGTVQALRLLMQWRPKVVVSTGGYAAAPVGAAAALLGVAIVVQEQNLAIGVANRVLARWARAISVSHDRVARALGPRAVATGVPVRRGAVGGDRTRGRRAFGLQDRPLTILVLGGSQGARSLNAAVVDMAPALPSGAEVQILHQTGQEHEAWVRARIATRSESVHYVVVPYIETMADAYACADLVICRAGAATLAEVTANGLPVIVVPYPLAADGHQDLNAQVLEEAGAAVVIRDHDLSTARLAGAIAAVRADPSRRRAMAEASRKLGRPQAAEQVAEMILKTAGGNGA